MYGYFKPVGSATDGNSASNLKSFTCLLCSVVIKSRYTAHLKRHLQMRHRDVFEQLMDSKNALWKCDNYEELEPPELPGENQVMFTLE